VQLRHAEPANACWCGGEFELDFELRLHTRYRAGDRLAAAELSGRAVNYGRVARPLDR
jgi:hypothetical protein